MEATLTPIKHPAKYSEPLYPWLRAFAGEPRTILDPFAGAGGIFKLQPWFPSCTIYGLEIEKDYAALHPLTQVGDALALPWAANTIDTVITSPTYGNRFSDKHKAMDGSTRYSYTHNIGHELHPNNSGAMQWGEKYRAFHIAAWKEVYRVLVPGGRFILNIGNHIRAGVEINVADWHRYAIQDLGFAFAAVQTIQTKKMRKGANSSARIPYEYVMLFMKESKGLNNGQ